MDFPPPPRAGATRRIAVVPAYNEEPTVAAVLDRLYPVVDELVVVDDGSTDGTRAAIEAWLPGHERARLLCHETNQGMSEAYYLAFTDLRRRMEAGELSPDDLIFTVDADGQHELSVLDHLEQITREERLDALIVRRDLSTYPRYKQVGNWVMSAWATLWAGHSLPDVESGYRIVRLGALAGALHYYKGYKYSETVEVAVILCRLGYRVRNDLVVPVPIYRSRTNLKDVIIDLAVMPAAWWRVMALRATPAGLPRQAAVWLPLLILAPFVALLAVIGSKNIFLGVDAINNYVHVWYLNEELVKHLDFPLRAEPLDSGRATALPYGGVPWLLGSVLFQFIGPRSVTLLLVAGLAGLVGAATYVRPAMRSPWMMILFILNPFFVDAVFSVQFPFIWSSFFFFLFVIALDRRQFGWAGALAWLSVSAQPVNGGLAVAAYTLWAFYDRPDERLKLVVISAVCAVALAPVAVLTLETPALSDNGRLLIVRSIIADIPRRGLLLGFPFIVQALAPLLLRHYRLAAGAVAAALAIWLPFANGAFGIAEGNYTAGLLHDPRDPYREFVASPAFVRGAHYRVLTPNEREEGFYYLARNGAVLASELFTESQFKRSFRPEQYPCFVKAKEVDFVLVERDYFRQYPTNEREVLQALVSSGKATLAFSAASGRYEVFDVRPLRAEPPEPPSVASCRLRPPGRVAAAR